MKIKNARNTYRRLFSTMEVTKEERTPWPFEWKRGPRGARTLEPNSSGGEKLTRVQQRVWKDNVPSFKVWVRKTFAANECEGKLAAIKATA